jgi:hypothetical protein
VYVADDFRPVLAAFDPAELAGSLSATCGLRRDLSLALRNEAWTAFGRANGATAPEAWDDRCVLDAITGELRSFYGDLFREVQASGRPADHAYACPSPERHRRFVMRVVPAPSDALLVQHHLVVDRPHETRGGEPLDDRYADHGVVTVCSHCRRTRRVHEPQTWDWVPGYLRPGVARVSHGLCPVCLRFYYTGTPARPRPS